jgi:hypothetical protein
MTDNTLQLVPTRSPYLPTAPTEYDPRAFHQLTDALRVYFNQIDSRFQQVLLGFNNYGSFLSTATQTNPVGGAANAVTYDTTMENYGVYVDSVNTSRVYVVRDGVYNFQFSAQLDHTGGGSVTFFIWYAIGGTPVANSATKMVLSGPNDEKCAAWNFVTSMAAGTYFELMWSSSDTAAVLAAAAASSPVPAVPSVILTVSYMYPAGTVR